MHHALKDPGQGQVAEVPVHHVVMRSDLHCAGCWTLSQPDTLLNAAVGQHLS